MHVSQENIEELFFEYFEGNLSETAKVDLLQFVHLHPEYEKDFAQWAQSYAHIEEVVPDYGIAQSLLKKPPVLLPLKQLLVGGTLSVGLVVLFSVLFWRSSDKEVETNSFSKNELPVAPLNTAVKNEIKTSLKSSTQSAPIVKSELKERRLESPTIEKEEQQEELPVNEYLDVPISSEPFTETAAETVSHVEETNSTALLKPDSLPTKAKEESLLAPLRKKKQKLPLNLKPSPDFMPVNDNF